MKRLVVSPLVRRCFGVTVFFCLAISGALTGPATASEGVIDISTADVATLADRLAGIGPVKARNIVEYRQQHGPFRSLDELLAVPGIGPATLAQIRAQVTLKPPRTPTNQTASDDPAGLALSTSELVRVEDGVNGSASLDESELAIRDAIQRLKSLAIRDAEQNGHGLGATP